MNGTRGVVVDALKGAVAGAAATWVMGQATTWLYEHEGEAPRQREDAARGGHTAYERAAIKAAAVAGIPLAEDRQSQAGTLIHWLTGIGAGAAYAVSRRRWPSMARAKGLPFGAGFFLGVDELLNPLLGLTPGPRAFPWQAHFRGFAGHLVFGAATELALEGLDRVA